MKEQTPDMKTSKNLLLIAVAFILPVTSILAQPEFTEQTNVLFTSQFYSKHPIVVSDMNRDGLDDLVRSEEGETLVIDYQQPDGSFVEVNVGEIENTDNDGLWGMCAGDLDNNGVMDVVCGGRYDRVKTIYANADGDLFTQEQATDVEIFLQAITLLDLDNDGDLDIFACHDDGPSQVLRNDGMDGFTEDYSVLDTDLFPTTEMDAGNYGIVYTDINADGLPDVYISKCRQGVTDPDDERRINQFFVSNEAGEYVEMAEAFDIDDQGQSWSSDFGDIDNDGDMDLFVGNHDQPSRIYRNNGDGTFDIVTSEVGLSGEINLFVVQSIFRDFDNDGHLDLLVSGGGAQRFCMNDGDGTFTVYDEVLDFDLNSFALGDLNDDGFIDIYGTPGGYGSWFTSDTLDALYMNQANDNNYLAVSLEGTESNLNAIGAQVKLYGPWGVQTRDVRAGESYGIQNSLKAYFGMGQEEMADSLVISWPSGQVDTYLEVEANQDLWLIEGDSPSSAETARANPQFSIYPNPTRSNITVVLNGPAKGDRLIQVYSLEGKLLLERSSREMSAIVLEPDLPAGQYLLSVSRQDGSRTVRKFAVTR